MRTQILASANCVRNLLLGKISEAAFRFDNVGFIVISGDDVGEALCENGNGLAGAAADVDGGGEGGGVGGVVGVDLGEERGVVGAGGEVEIPVCAVVVGFGFPDVAAVGGVIGLIGEEGFGALVEGF